MARQWRHGSLICLVIALAVGAGVRFYALGAKDLWLDEALSWRLQEMPLSMLIERTGEPSTANPPLFFLLLHFWTRWLGDSEWAMRSLSALAGTLTIPAVWLLTHQVTHFIPPRTQLRVTTTGRWSGSVAAGLFALSPLHVYLAKQARGYALAGLFLVVGSWTLLRALREQSAVKSRFLWTFYALLMLACCYTHYLALFSLAGQLAFAVAYLSTGWLRSGQPTAKHTAVPASPEVSRGQFEAAGNPRLGFGGWGAVGSILLLVLCYAPWVPRLLQQSQAVRSSWMRPFVVHDCASEIYAALAATGGLRQDEPVALRWAVTTLVLGVLVYLLLRLGWAGLFCLLTVAVPAGLLILYSAYSMRSIFDARYLTFAQCPMLIGISLACGAIAHLPERAIASAALIGSSLYVLSDNWDVLGGENHPGMRDVAAYITQSKTANEVVTCTSPDTFFPLAYYMRDASSAPTLLTPIADRHRQPGAAHLYDHEIVTTSDLLSRPITGIWIVTHPGANLMLHLPQSEVWELADHRQFLPELRHRPDRPITVYHYQLRR